MHALLADVQQKTTALLRVDQPDCSPVLTAKVQWVHELKDRVKLTWPL